MMKKNLFVLFFVLGILFPFAQTNYFVSSTTGSDSNDGSTWQTAFATIDKAVTLGENTAGTYNVYVATGSYTMESHTLVGGVQMNLYGGFPVPNENTPPTTTCTAAPSPTEESLITTDISNSVFRLTGDGGGLLINGFSYSGTASGGVADGTFLTMDGDQSAYPDASTTDCRNKTVTFDEFIIHSYTASSGGFIYPYNIEDC